MAAKSKQTTRNSWEVDFVNVSLAKEQKAALAKWDTSGEITSDTITRLVADGYKLSISADKAHDCCGAYLTGPASSDGARKRCLSARGPDFFSSLKALAFKHIVVLDADWGDKSENGEQLDQWG